MRKTNWSGLKRIVDSKGKYIIDNEIGEIKALDSIKLVEWKEVFEVK